TVNHKYKLSAPRANPENADLPPTAYASPGSNHASNSASGKMHNSASIHETNTSAYVSKSSSKPPQVPQEKTKTWSSSSHAKKSKTPIHYHITKAPPGVMPDGVFCVMSLDLLLPYGYIVTTN
ncbi:MAG: hypothetical protein RR419_09090, partial [Akkermansia sp.]